MNLTVDLVSIMGIPLTADLTEIDLPILANQELILSRLTAERMAKLDLIGTGAAIVQTPVLASGEFAEPLVIGDDYLASIGRPIEWTITCSVVPNNARLGFRRAGKTRATSDKFTLSASGAQIVSLGDNRYQLRFNLPGATTTGKTPDEYEYHLDVRDAAGNKISFYHSHFFAEDGTPARNYATLVERFIEES